jgi:hypothetical protein
MPGFPLSQKKKKKKRKQKQIKKKKKRKLKIPLQKKFGFFFFFFFFSFLFFFPPVSTLDKQKNKKQNKKKSKPKKQQYHILPVAGVARERDERVEHPRERERDHDRALLAHVGVVHGPGLDRDPLRPHEGQGAAAGRGTGHAQGEHAAEQHGGGDEPRS